MVMGGLAATTQDWFAGLIFILTLLVALLSISFFGTLFFLLSSNTVLVKSLIAIILVEQELNFVVQDC